VAASRDVGRGRSVLFLLWGWGVALVAECSSTRAGIPFGLYHYTGLTRGRELYILDVPFFDSLSFPFLAYAAFCLSRLTLRVERGARVVGLAGVLMMLLDVVVDPLAVRGDRWFLGRIFYYPAGGVYFGVPLSNFAGWLLVGWATVGGYLAMTRPAGHPSEGAREGSPAGGVVLYYGVLLFNLAITFWIGEWGLLAAGILVQAGAGLLLYGIGARLRRKGPRAGVSVRRAPGHARHDLDSTRSRGS
jgi:uncharacterized membrane protein